MQPQSDSSAEETTADSQLIEPGEQVLAVVKKHWMGLVTIMATTFTALIALLVLAIVLGTGAGGVDSSTYGMIMGIGVFIVALLMLMMFVMSYIYRQSKFTITEESLVQIVQTSLFSRKVSRLSMSNVEDVTATQRGLMQTMFHYGTLTVETAGEEDNFVFSLCPNPNHYAQIILDARQKYALQRPAK